MLTLEEMLKMTFPENSVEFALRQHGAYVQFALNKLLPMFSLERISSEVNKFEAENNELKEILCESALFPGNVQKIGTEDMAYVFRQQLWFLREEIVKLMLVGLYHMWERSIANFLRMEDKDFGIEGKSVGEIPHARFSKIKSWLHQGYFASEILSKLDRIELLLLITNTAKHPSKGVSWKQLRKFDYGASDLPGPLWDHETDEPYFTEAHFSYFAKHINDFWQGVHDQLVELGRAKIK